MKCIPPGIKPLILISLLVFACPLAPVYADNTPSFSLAWSEYPSWSTFGVADEVKLIDGKKGKMGPIEKKWNVDIILKEADYDSCLVMYGAGQCDAVCITNMDVLNPSLTRPSAAILPTSTSNGADALIVTQAVKSIKDLRGKKVYGLAKTVSEYLFVRGLEMAGEKEKDYTFTNMDPSAAALALQQKKGGFDAITVWNPFVLETLNKRKDVRVLLDSAQIPGEIIDMVAVAQKSLDAPGGEAFACAVIDTYYQLVNRMDDPKTADDTLIALGEKFSNLDLAAMKMVVVQTQFYKKPDEGKTVLSSGTTQKIMDKVVDFCVTHEILARPPVISYGKPAQGKRAMLVFDPAYIEKVNRKP